MAQSVLQETWLLPSIDPLSIGGRSRRWPTVEVTKYHDLFGKCFTALTRIRAASSNPGSEMELDTVVLLIHSRI